MKTEKIFIGIDVSKSTLDVYMQLEETHVHEVIKNTKRAITSFLKQMINEYSEAEVFIALENTGLYNWQFYAAIKKFEIPLYVLHPLNLKKSMGMVRGKNDKIDAKRIADYLRRHITELKAYIIPDDSMQKMKVLTAQRRRLVAQRKALKTAEKEVQITGLKEINQQINKLNNNIVLTINNSIKKIETLIQKLIESSESLRHTFQLITSVPGVGKVLGWELLIKTNNFRNINDPRKLACYAGVVPFDYSSGTSVFKKPRVSVFADRKLKKLLHMAALRVIQLEGELSAYYKRKVQQGKNKMSVINALRNKIVARVCATVKNNQKYVDYTLDMS